MIAKAFAQQEEVPPPFDGDWKKCMDDRKVLN